MTNSWHVVHLDTVSIKFECQCRRLTFTITEGRCCNRKSRDTCFSVHIIPRLASRHSAPPLYRFLLSRNWGHVTTEKEQTLFSEGGSRVGGIKTLAVGNAIWNSISLTTHCVFPERLFMSGGGGARVGPRRRGAACTRAVHD